MRRILLCAGMLLGLAGGVMIGRCDSSFTAEGGASDAWEAVFAKISPAVVVVRTVRAPVIGENGESVVEAEGPPGEARAEGSGMIFAAEGWVVTNRHVVAGAERVEVELADGRIVEAEVAGEDEETDVAVLRLAGTGTESLPVVEWGDSDEVRTGQAAGVIGAPYGLKGSFSAGVVSGTGRDLPDASELVGYLQTDADITFGHSGGPLCDRAGRVIGMNTLATQGRGSFGFAAPSNLVRAVAEELRRTGRVRRAWLGLRAESARERAGALVLAVTAGGPADGAGLRTGDVVTALDDVAVADDRDLQRRTLQLAIGAEARLEVWRDGERREVRLRTAEKGG